MANGREHRTGRGRDHGAPDVALSPRIDSPAVQPDSLVLHPQPVADRHRRDLAWLVLGLVVAVVVAGVWKPWASDTPGARSPASSAGASLAATAGSSRTPPALPAATAAGGAAAAVADNGASYGLRPPPGLAVAGLDVSFIGLVDDHASWGVSVAYVPRPTIVAAVQAGKPTVTPVADWLSADAARAVSATAAESTAPSPDSDPGLVDAGFESALNHPGSVAIAVAVTWPRSVHPVAVELVDLGSKASISGGAGRGRPAGPVDLVEPLPAIVRSVPSGLHAVLALARVHWELRPGTFFLPAGDLPAAPGGWLTGGWRAGSYEFRVTTASGTVTTLPFSIGN